MICLWDSNKFSIDGFFETRGWIKVDLQPLQEQHITYDNKFRKINNIYSKNKCLGRKLYTKYRKRCKNRIKYLMRYADEAPSSCKIFLDSIDYNPDKIIK